MERIHQVIQSLKDLTRQNSLQNSQPEPEYNCDKCKDQELIFDKETNIARFCECREAKSIKRLYDKSGLSKLFDEKTFDNFSIERKSKEVVAAKQISMNFANSFDGKTSMALLGQVGAGKTHLCTAACGVLLKKNVGVLYMQYREAITELKKLLCDKESEEDYTKKTNQYKNASVLYIDDLYKGAIKQGFANDSDIRIMFEIINHRYNNRKPVIVSCELGIEKILSFDEAIGSRIIEMCKGFIVEFPQNLSLNHRLVG